MLIRRYSPLFVDSVFIAEVIGELNEQISKVHIFEKSFFRMFVISVARVSN